MKRLIVKENQTNFIGAWNIENNELCKNIISFFQNNSKVPQNIEKLQRKVWGHNSSLETHTVETHIYRLRKKIKEIFNDDNFLLSKKDGYTIN